MGKDVREVFSRSRAGFGARLKDAGAPPAGGGEGSGPCTTV
jgi:hypothetical protein